MKDCPGLKDFGNHLCLETQNGSVDYIKQYWSVDSEREEN